jgi:hypothetical protein
MVQNPNLAHIETNLSAPLISNNIVYIAHDLHYPAQV